MGRYSRGQRVYSAWHWAQQAGWKFQRFWWHLLETWPFSSLAIFIKSLPLLALWLSLAFVAFKFLPPTLKTPDKETLSLLVTLITALIGFGVQQWKILTEEERSKQQKCQEALDEIAKLKTLIQSDPSEGARRYIEMRGQGGVWKSSRIRSHLEAEWSAAPRELQNTVELLGHLEDVGGFHKIVRRLSADKSAKALEWAKECLDDEWQQKALNGLLLLGTYPEYRQHIASRALQDIEQGPWHAIFRAWPHISFWRGLPPPTDPETAKGLDYLGLKSNPFGSEEAEADTLLLTCTVDPPWLEELHTPQPAVLTGPLGSGKTATALLLARDSLQEQDAFPVYYPAALGDLRLERFAQALAKTLLHYLVVTPVGFLKCRVAEKTAMACLVARHTCSSLPICLHRAGLPLAGDGAKMLKEIELLVQDGSPHKILTDEELLTLLSKARPHGFQHTMLLLDVHEQAGKSKDTVLDLRLQSLLDLSDRLMRVGVFIKAFLPDAFQEPLERRGVIPTLVQWLDKDSSGEGRDLSTLLENYLKQAGEVNLTAWCNMRDLQDNYVQQSGRDAMTAWYEVTEGEASPNNRLLKAARGTPGGLIHKGKELLRHIGREQRHLMARDLDMILGPLPV